MLPICFFFFNGKYTWTQQLLLLKKKKKKCGGGECIEMFTAALCVISKNWELLIYSLTGT